MEFNDNQVKSRPRLIVLMPACVDHSIELAHQIHRMASGEDRDVLYFTLEDDHDDGLRRTREMATLKAVTAGSRLEVSWLSAGSDDWLSTLQTVARPEDVVVYHTEQQVNTGLFRRVGIRNVLKDSIPSPVRPVSGYYQPDKRLVKGWPGELLFLAGFLSILAVFTWLEIWVGQSNEGIAGLILVFLIFCIQCGMLWAWNRIANA